jgi:RNA recognition motif-containing protein
MGDPQIYVRGFSKSTAEDDLRTAFGAFGSIKEVRMIRDYAFIVTLTDIQVFDSEDAVHKAVDGMNGKEVNDTRVRVEVAGQPKKPKGPQPNDECRLCGRKGHWYILIYPQEK